MNLFAFTQKHMLLLIIVGVVFILLGILF